MIGADDAEPPPGGEPVPDDVAWRSWTPDEALERLRDIDVPWGVAAGWAIDLFRGAQTREHDDLEIAVPLSSFHKVRAALADLDFDVIGPGRRWPLDHPAYDVFHQTWGRRADGVYVVDVFREPHDGDTWICRRDAGITRAYAEVFARTRTGVPYVVPEIALLFKARHRREKDEHDFAGAMPLLSAAQRRWLRAALERVHPGHDWIARLDGLSRTPSSESPC